MAAQWHHLFGLLSVLCISFGALFFVFNSDFGEVCDYSDVIESCSDFKTYIADPAKDNRSMAHEYKVVAQEYRNQSEVEKCNIEEALLQNLQNRERTEAERLINNCMADFKNCVSQGYTTTTPAPTAVDCTACGRFCQSTKWTTVDAAYANLMGGNGYNGECEKEVCPWQPQCGPSANFFYPNPSSGQCSACPCQALLCSTTTTTTSLTETTTATTSTSTTTTTATSTTSTSTTTTATTTTTTSTSTTLPSTSTITTTTSTTTLTTTTSTNTTTTTTSTSTSTTSTSTSTTTTTTSVPPTTTLAACTCPPGVVGTVIVGRPMSVFTNEPSWDYDKVLYWQGVVVETADPIAIGFSSTFPCREYFSDKTKYAGLRLHSSASGAVSNAANNHPDLGCGYTGTFTVSCSPNGTANCSKEVDVSSCTPPTYTQALNDCLQVTTTTTRYIGVTQATVPDFLTVEDEPFELASLPPEFTVHSQSTTPLVPCCEVHVGSVCDPHTNFGAQYHIGPTVDGRWRPDLSYAGDTGYFPTAPCSFQPQSQPRPCPRVKIKELTNAASIYAQWPSCSSVCNTAKVLQDFSQICNRTLHPSIQQQEEAAHQDKINSMKAKRSQLEGWTTNRMRTVTSTSRVTDCIADTLPRRYNGMGLPVFRSGYDKLPLQNDCRLHSCTYKQCLKITQPCPVPFLQSSPEQNCGTNLYAPSFTCIDKVGINSNDPMSLGFAAAWIVIGSIFFCAGIASWIRNYSKEQDALHARPGARTSMASVTDMTKYGA